MEALSKAKVKLFASLNLKKFREEHRLFLIEGRKMVAEALAENLVPEALIVRSGYEWEGSVPQNVQVFQANAQDFERISGQKNPEGILAVMQMPQQQGENELNTPSLLLWNMQDPGNLGTIIRTADWFGISQIICTQDTVDCYNPKVLRASMGSIFRVRMTYMEDLEGFVKENAQTTAIADLAGTPLPAAELSRCQYLLIGNEANGVPEKIRQIQGLERVFIPGKGGAESLNAAISAAILCYAWKG